MKTTTRNALMLAMAAAATVGLAACGSSTSSESTPAPAATESVAAEPAPVSAAPAVVSTEPIPTTCPEFAMTAAHMSTYWQYLNLNLGSTNDEAPTLANLSSGAKAMQSLAPECAPKAVDSIDAFAATVEAIQPIYTTQPTGDAVQQVNDALAAMQEAGAAMFADMGQSDYAWQ